MRNKFRYSDISGSIRIKTSFLAVLGCIRINPDLAIFSYWMSGLQSGNNTNIYIYTYTRIYICYARRFLVPAEGYMHAYLGSASGYPLSIYIYNKLFIFYIRYWIININYGKKKCLPIYSPVFPEFLMPTPLFL